MNLLNKQSRILVLKCLLEGNSIRSTARIVGVSKTTVLKLLADSGKACLEFQEEKMKNLICRNIEVDEIWSYIYSKKKTTKDVPSKGDSWTWTSICTETKIVPCWYVGDRSSESADAFIKKLAGCMRSKPQVTSDGYMAYETAMGQFMSQSDYGMLTKKYIKKKSGNSLLILKKKIQGNPDINKISTSCVERQNLNIRMGLRRFTRKTNAFSKKIENHHYALSLYFYYYNFVRRHRTLRTTPANRMGIEPEKGLDSILYLIGRRYEKGKKSAL